MFTCAQVRCMSYVTHVLFVENDSYVIKTVNIMSYERSVRTGKMPCVKRIPVCAGFTLMPILAVQLDLDIHSTHPV